MGSPSSELIYMDQKVSDSCKGKGLLLGRCHAQGRQNDWPVRLFVKSVLHLSCPNFSRLHPPHRAPLEIVRMGKLTVSHLEDGRSSVSHVTRLNLQERWGPWGHQASCRNLGIESWVTQLFLMHGEWHWWQFYSALLQRQHFLNPPNACQLCESVITVS